MFQSSKFTPPDNSGVFPNDIIIDIDDDLVFSGGVTKGVCIVKNGKTEESTKDGSLTICHLY